MARNIPANATYFTVFGMMLQKMRREQDEDLALPMSSYMLASGAGAVGYWLVGAPLDTVRCVVHSDIIAPPMDRRWPGGFNLAGA